jgi:hypothetical protein
MQGCARPAPVRQLPNPFFNDPQRSGACGVLNPPLTVPCRAQSCRATIRIEGCGAPPAVRQRRAPTPPFGKPGDGYPWAPSWPDGQRYSVRFSPIATDLCAPQRTRLCANRRLMHRTKIGPANRHAQGTNKETKIQGAISVRATRKPRLLVRWSADIPTRIAERTKLSFQEPPRTIRFLQPWSIQAEPSVGAWRKL